MNKKCLNGEGKSITESLTAVRMQKLKNARDEHVFFNVWTVDGKIMFKNSDNGKPSVYYGSAGRKLKIYGKENYTID